MIVPRSPYVTTIRLAHSCDAPAAFVVDSAVLVMQIDISVIKHNGPPAQPTGQYFRYPNFRSSSCERTPWVPQSLTKLQPRPNLSSPAACVQAKLWPAACVQAKLPRAPTRLWHLVHRTSPSAPIGLQPPTFAHSPSRAAQSLPLRILEHDHGERRISCDNHLILR